MDQSRVFLSFFIAFSVLSLALTEETPGIKLGNSREIDCTQGSQCQSCQVGAYCNPPDLPSYMGCPDATVCVAESIPSCESASTLSTKECGCGPEDDGMFRDLYDFQRYYSCNNSEIEYFVCSDDHLFSNDEERCVAIVPCAATGCYGIIEECDAYFCCALDPGTGMFEETFYTCEEEDYVYDYASEKCIDPIFTCSNNTDGFYQDPRKCDLYHLCNDQEIVFSKCCDIGETVDLNNPPTYCSPDVNGCGFVSICYDDYWESSTCSNKCVNLDEDDVFGSHNPCTKFYYQCEPNDEGVLFPNAKECPGDTIFNDDVEKCDDKENVTEC